MKRVLRKLPYDVVLCLGLLFPNLFPGVSFGSGIQLCFVVMVCILEVLVILATLSVFVLMSQGKKAYKPKELNDIDCYYRVYEPISDLAITISIVVSGHPVLGGIFLFTGLILREVRYKELAEYKSEGKIK